MTFSAHKTARVVLAATVILMAGPAPGQEARISAGETLYVPVYSHLPAGDSKYPVYLAATLSIRNIDPHNTLTVTAVEYHDSDGSLIREFLKSPEKVAPRASVNHMVKESDKTGGIGANFLVRWESQTPMNAPVVEAVMIGVRSQQGISFTSRGVPVAE